MARPTASLATSSGLALKREGSFFQRQALDTQTYFYWIKERKGKERYSSKEDTEHPFRASNKKPLSALQPHLPNFWDISQTVLKKVLKMGNKSKDRELKH